MSKERTGLYLAWNLWFYFCLVILTIICSLGAVIGSFFDRTGSIGQGFARWWGSALLWLGRIPVEVRGLENLSPGQTYVYAANHRSQFDIFVLLKALPGNFVWVAKKSLFKIPLFGPALARSGSMPIDRDNRQEAIRTLNMAIDKVRAGCSMLVFPEGTRASTRELLPFKKGVFVLAFRAGQPVVPVTINGTMAIQPRGALRLRPGPIQVVISPPIDPKQFKRKEELMDAVREAIAAHLDPDYPHH
jgi:1-acyl-sn-glycerol-3-phosphate acyltransferase